MNPRHPVLALLLAACSGQVPVASKADPRLGVVVLETSAQVYGRAPHYVGDQANGHVVVSRTALATGPSGDSYTLITLNSSRPFGTTTTRPSATFVSKVSPTNEVTALPAPALGSEGEVGKSYLRIAGDGQPYLVEAMSAENERGRYVQVTTFDGTAWHQVAFVRADRSTSDFTERWTQAEDQVRVFDASHVVVQHGNALTAFDGSRWAEIAAPEHLLELRLGTGDATRLRAYWVTDDGFLKSDLLTREGTWAGTPTSLHLSNPLTLKGVFGFSGTLETFTIHTQHASSVAVYRHENTAFSLVVERPPLNSELQGLSYLAPSTTDPNKGAMYSNGAFTAEYQGRSTGPLGALPGGQQGGATVTCPTACTVKEGFPVGSEPDCATCVERSVQLTAWSVSPDVSEVQALYADPRQDATERFYLKRIPLPSMLTDVTQAATASGSFPGAP